METFGKRNGDCREAKKLSQSELAKLNEAHHSIICKYQRYEVKPSIDVVNKIANVFDTTACYLLGESQDKNILKGSSMLKRLNEIPSFNDFDNENILYTIDGLNKSVKIKNIATI